MQIFNARTQQEEDVVWSKASNSEIVATFTDSGFLKFPVDVTRADLETLVAAHRNANEGQEVITAEMLAHEAETDALLDELNGNTMPESNKTNASKEQDNP